MADTNFSSRTRAVVFQLFSRNHVGKRCVEERDPYKIRDLDNVNTQACEQLFRDVNKHTNCQAMSEANFFMFWIYLMDLHNLAIAGFSRVEPDPREEYRTSIIKPNNMDLSRLNAQKKEKKLRDEEASGQLLQTEKPVGEDSGMNKVLAMLGGLDIDTLKCPVCEEPFKREGHLKNHLLKHEEGQKTSSEKQGLCCKLCSLPCASKLALDRHVKVKHLTCSICKVVYATVEEAANCRSRHTTCSVCSFDAKFPSKLTRHMESHK